MKKDSAFVEHFVDLMHAFGHVTTRAMFGGWSLYKDGTIFAISIDGVLYLKVTHTNRAAHEKAGTQPFTYETANGTATMSYHAVPENILERSATLCEWAREAWEGSRLAAAAKPIEGKRTTKQTVSKKGAKKQKD